MTGSASRLRHFTIRGSVHKARYEACGRALYPAPEGVDSQLCCQMHSNAHNMSNEDFQAEFERILDQAGQKGKWADFTGFAFPELL
jgi:hypothetical protein